MDCIMSLFLPSLSPLYWRVRTIHCCQGLSLVSRPIKKFCIIQKQFCLIRSFKGGLGRKYFIIRTNSQQKILSNNSLVLKCFLASFLPLLAKMRGRIRRIATKIRLGQKYFCRPFELFYRIFGHLATVNMSYNRLSHYVSKYDAL